MGEHEILVKGLNLLEKEGWGQGDFCSNPSNLGHEGRKYCVFTAVDNASNFHSDWVMGASAVLCDLLGFTDDQLGSPQMTELFCWNDDPVRTWEQVKALFEEAIRETAPEPAWEALSETVEGRTGEVVDAF